MGIVDNGYRNRMANPATSNGIRRVEIGSRTLVLLGPGFGHPALAYVDILEHAGGRHNLLYDRDLVKEFDAGMDPGPWLDMVAERHPDLQWAADLYGRLMSGADE